MFERTLPIGSVVLLKGAEKRLMIIGYGRYLVSDETHLYDYAACLYPEGFLSPETTVVFDHEQIERVYALGYQNEQRFAWEPRLREALEKAKSERQ